MLNLCDLHTHSVLSNHAYSSLTENIEWAKAHNLKYYGISEHQPDDFKVGANKHAFNAISRVPREIEGTYILRACEFNIMENGIIDPHGVILELLDYGIASIHSYAYFGKKDAQTITNCVLKALDYDFINILGHINEAGYEMDYEKIVLKTKELHKLIEFNNSKIMDKIKSKNNIENMKVILALCKKYEQPIIINSDAHIKYEIGKIDAALNLLEEMAFPEKLIINFDEELFKEYFWIK